MSKHTDTYRHRTIGGLAGCETVYIATKLFMKIAAESFSNQNEFACNMQGFQEGLILAFENPDAARRILNDFTAHQDPEFNHEMVQMVRDFIEFADKGETNGHYAN